MLEFDVVDLSRICCFQTLSERKHLSAASNSSFLSIFSSSSFFLFSTFRDNNFSKNKPGTISRASMQQELEDMDRVAVDHRHSELFVPLLLQQHLKCKVVTGCLTINNLEFHAYWHFDKYSK